MTDEKKIVEVKVVTGTGEEVPIGLMNVRQAMKLPEELDVTVSHPENEAVSTGAANEKAGLGSSPRSGAASDFPAPSTEVEAERFKEARKTVRLALDDLVASANRAGWKTDEIVVAIMEAGQAIKDSCQVEFDPADDPAVSDTVRPGKA